MSKESHSLEVAEQRLEEISPNAQDIWLLVTWAELFELELSTWAWVKRSKQRTGMPIPRPRDEDSAVLGGRSQIREKTKSPPKLLTSIREYSLN